MMILSEDQPNNLNREALIIIVASLQDQLASVQSQLDTANTQLADTNHQIELLTEQIRIMNQRHFGRQAESNLTEGLIASYRRKKNAWKKRCGPGWTSGPNYRAFSFGRRTNQALS